MGDALLPFGFGVAASLATLGGGSLALRIAARMNIVMALAAGVVLGVAFLDLIPEACSLSRGLLADSIVPAATAVGFSAYMLLDRVLARSRSFAPVLRDYLGPAALTMHSLLDGMGIGFAFQVDPAIGWTVALAVLTHDFADGINTVSLSLTTQRREVARRWLLANGAAPLLGVAIGLAVRIPATMLAPLLAVFAGIFIFIGACELIPRSHARDPRLRTSVASVAGVLLMVLVSRLSH